VSCENPSLETSFAVVFFRVLQHHPSLGHAAMFIAAAVNEEGTKSTGNAAASSRSKNYISLKPPSLIGLLFPSLVLFGSNV
jgi:hypothetical protein